MKQRSLLWCFCIALFVSASCCVASSPQVSDEGTTFYQKGTAAVKSGNYSEAASALEQAILHKHNDADTFYQLGLVYSKLKRWNDAMWSIGMALTDSIFYATRPNAWNDLMAAQAAGGVNEGPPAILRSVTDVKPTPASAAHLPTPEDAALQESRAAFTALQSGAYFVAPAYNKIITFKNVGALSLAAQDADTESNTTVKFIYLGATPTPYKSLLTYTKEFFTRLKLDRAVLVVITPRDVAAYTDRLEAREVNELTAQQRASQPDPVTLGASLARTLVQHADDSDTIDNRRSLAIAAAVILVVLLAVGFGILRIARGTNRQTRVG